MNLPRDSGYCLPKDIKGVIVRSNWAVEEKREAINDFRRIVERTLEHPATSELVNYRSWYGLMRETQYMLFEQLDYLEESISRGI